MALRRGSALWASYDRVLRDTARTELPRDVDVEACRTILELVGTIERGETADPDEAQLAVRTILGSYPRAHLHDPEVMATMMALVMVERAPGIVLMAVDRRKGIPARCPYPPSIAQMTTIIDDIAGKVTAAGFGARKGLGLPPAYADRRRPRRDDFRELGMRAAV